MIGSRVGSFSSWVGSSVGSSADDESSGNVLQILVGGGQSNRNGWAFVANQISVPNIAFPLAAVKYIDHNATVNGDPLGWTFDRPVALQPLPALPITPVSLSPRPGDANGDAGFELASMQRLNRAQPGRWAYAKMAIPSSSMLNWEAVGSAYPTALPHLIDQWTAYLLFCEQALGGRIAGIVWQQGESDCQTAPLSSVWETRMTNFIAATRTALGRTVPFYLPKMHTGAGGAFNATIRAAQVNLQTNVPRVKIIDVDPLAVGALHYTADQYALGGVIEAKTILADLGINDPPFAKFTHSWAGTTVTLVDTSTVGAGSTIVTRLYDYGDGSTGTSGVHVYGALGTYTVSLTVTDDRGGTNTVTKLITCAAGNWTVDDYGFAVPASSAEWTALMTAAGIGFIPNASRRPGSVAATPIPDDIAGAFPLAVAGATVAFQSTVPDVNTKALRTIHNTTDGASTTDVALPDVSTTSCCTGEIYVHWTVPTGNRGIFAMGTTEAAVTVNAASPPRLVIRHNTQNTTGTVNLDNLPHIHFLNHNRTASSCVYTGDLESINVAFAGTVTGKRERMGLTNLQAAGGQHILHFRFDGANAEALTPTVLRTLGRCMGFFMP